MTSQSLVQGTYKITSKLTLLWQGMYLEAFRRVFDILEDSGWTLVRENEELDDVSLDDIPNIPYMQQM